MARIPVDTAFQGDSTSPRRRAATLCFRFLLALLGPLLTGASLYAQGWAPYGYSPYPQPMPMPYGNPYYGNYQSNTVPGYIYPRPATPYSQGYSNGNGVTYYYVQDSAGPNYYRHATPYSTPRPVYHEPRGPSGATWPAPVNTPAYTERYRPTEEEALGDGRKPVVTFHRTPNEAFWVHGEYIGTFLRPMRTPLPLVTTGSEFDARPGAIAQPATSVLFGNSSVDYGMQSGARFEAGTFLDAGNRFSLELAGFFVLPNSQSFNAVSDANGNPVISRPIFNTADNVEGAFLNALPGKIAGTLSIESKSEMFGLELNARYHAYLREQWHLDGLLGFRYLRLSERMRIREHINPIATDFLSFLGARVNIPNSLEDDDNFRTINQFFGPQIGGRASWEHKWFILDAYAKVGLGATREEASISGTTTLITPAGNSVANGGILALPANSGTQRRTVVGIVPEFGVNLGVDLWQHTRLQLGYSFLMWNHVVRPAGQMDRNVNPTQVPGSPTFGPLTGPNAPNYRFNDEFFWTHTFRIGLDIHF
ncbi:MAG: BBP7 family outer membrane beta-barrel protein [Planctomycetes bacterium]|nr:BBP7 family outer membrane beta-barrel protein [Planctomycetota bacterium]